EHRRPAEATKGDAVVGRRAELRGPRGNAELAKRFRGVQVRSERGGERVSTAVLSIGSNVGDRLAHLQGCVDRLRGTVRAVSAVYQAVPWGPVPQDDYYNAVLLVADDRTEPRGWLELAWAVEAAAGRLRRPGQPYPKGEVRWGPRTLDV